LHACRSTLEDPLTLALLTKFQAFQLVTQYVIDVAVKPELIGVRNQYGSDTLS